MELLKSQYPFDQMLLLADLFHEFIGQISVKYQIDTEVLIVVLDAKILDHALDWLRSGLDEVDGICIQRLPGNFQVLSDHDVEADYLVNSEQPEDYSFGGFVHDEGLLLIDFLTLGLLLNSFKKLLKEVSQVLSRRWMS